MYILFIFILIAICILTLSLMKYKEGACVEPKSKEAKALKIRTNDINERITDQTDTLSKISSRVNEILLNYSNFKFFITSVNVDNETNASANLEIDDKSTLSSPNFIFTLVTSPVGDKGDEGNQGIPGNKGDPGKEMANGLPGYWGQRGGCST